MTTPASSPGSHPANVPRGDGVAPTAADAAPTVFQRVQDSAVFARLRRSQRSFASVATAAFLSLYLLYVLLSSYAPGLMDGRVVGELNVAFFFGLAQFAATFLTAWLYTRHARNRRDPLAEQVALGIERELTAGRPEQQQSAGAHA